MKDNVKQAVTMRRIAGVLYGVYAIYQVVLSVFYLWGAALLYNSVPIAAKIELFSALAAAVFAVWLLAGDSFAPAVVRRGVIPATTLMVLYQLVTYRLQTTLLAEQIEGLGGGLTNLVNYGADSFYLDILKFLDKPMWQYVAIVVRLVLLILAAFFVISSKLEPELNKAIENDFLAMADEVVEDVIMEEIAQDVMENK